MASQDDHQILAQLAQPMTGFAVTPGQGDVIIYGTDSEGFATFTRVTYKELQGMAEASRNTREKACASDDVPGAVYSSAHNGYVTACAWPHADKVPAVTIRDGKPVCTKHTESRERETTMTTQESVWAELLEGPCDGAEMEFDGVPDPDTGYDGGAVPDKLVCRTDVHGRKLAEPATYVRASFPELDEGDHGDLLFFLDASHVTEYQEARTAKGLHPGTYATP